MSDYPPRFTFTPRGIAGVFLRQYAQGCGSQEQNLLGDIIEDAFNQGIYATLEKAKEEYTKIHTAGCPPHCTGGCSCFLCVMDNLAAEVKGTAS